MGNSLIGIDHIVFGTEIFFRGTHFMEWTSEFIDGFELTSGEREMVYEENAARILKLEAALAGSRMNAFRRRQLTRVLNRSNRPVVMSPVFCNLCCCLNSSLWGRLGLPGRHRWRLIRN